MTKSGGLPDSMDVIEKTIEEEFYVCDTCNYDRGFHVSFIREKNGFEIVLICPQCGQHFKINWRTKLA